MEPQEIYNALVTSLETQSMSSIVFKLLKNDIAPSIKNHVNKDQRFWLTLDPYRSVSNKCIFEVGVQGKLIRFIAGVCLRPVDQGASKYLVQVETSNAEWTEFRMQGLKPAVGEEAAPESDEEEKAEKNKKRDRSEALQARTEKTEAIKKSKAQEGDGSDDEEDDDKGADDEHDEDGDVVMQDAEQQRQRHQGAGQFLDYPTDVFEKLGFEQIVCLTGNQMMIPLDKRTSKTRTLWMRLDFNRKVKNNVRQFTFEAGGQTYRFEAAVTDQRYKGADQFLHVLELEDWKRFELLRTFDRSLPEPFTLKTSRRIGQKSIGERRNQAVVPVAAVEQPPAVRPAMPAIVAPVVPAVASMPGVPLQDGSIGAFVNQIVSRREQEVRAEVEAVFTAKLAQVNATVTTLAAEKEALLDRQRELIASEEAAKGEIILLTADLDVAKTRNALAEKMVVAAERRQAAMERSIGSTPESNKSHDDQAMLELKYRDVSTQMAALVRENEGLRMTQSAVLRDSQLLSDRIRSLEEQLLQERSAQEQMKAASEVSHAEALATHMKDHWTRLETAAVKAMELETRQRMKKQIDTGAYLELINDSPAVKEMIEGSVALLLQASAGDAK